MDKFQIGDRVNAADELEYLLCHNGFTFQRKEDRFRLVFSEMGRKWETICICREQFVMIYGRYPFPVTPSLQAMECCVNVNSQVIMGSMFLSEGHAVFRTGADLFDAYSAYEHIGRALEYNAGVMTRFWNKMAACVAK